MEIWGNLIWRTRGCNPLSSMTMTITMTSTRRSRAGDIHALHFPWFL